MTFLGDLNCACICITEWRLDFETLQLLSCSYRCKWMLHQEDTFLWRSSAPAVSKGVLYLQMSLLVHEPVTCLRVSLSYWNWTLKLSFIVLLVMFLSVTDYFISCWLWYSLIDHWRVKSRCWVHSLFEVGTAVLWYTDCHYFQWHLLPWSFALAEIICFSTFRAHGRC